MRRADRIWSKAAHAASSGGTVVVVVVTAVVLGGAVVVVVLSRSTWSCVRSVDVRMVFSVVRAESSRRRCFSTVVDGRVGGGSGRVGTGAARSAPQAATATTVAQASPAATLRRTVPSTAP